MYIETKAALKGAVLDPRLTWSIARSGIRLRAGTRTKNVRTLIGTHHKVLTAYMARVFRAYSVIAGRSFCRATYPNVDYEKEVIMDYHSRFELDRISGDYRGVHIRRDPRDVLVSCVLYHLKSTESWLHEEGNWGFVGSTYQKEIRALTSMEDRLIFELDHEGGRIVDGILSWDYARPEFVELKYESVVADAGMEYIYESFSDSGLFNSTECALFVDLFRLFSAREGVLAHKKHIRNPRPSQWKEHFSSNVERRLLERYGDRMEELGYS